MKRAFLLISGLLMALPAGADKSPSSPYPSSRIVAQLKQSVVVMSVAQTIDLVANPVTLLPAKAGVCYIPTQPSWMYRTGAAYLASTVNPGIYTDASTDVLWLHGAAANLTGVNNPYFLAVDRTGSVGCSSDAGDMGNKPLIWKLASATNPTVDGTKPGSPIYLVFSYWEVPMTYP